MQQMERLISRLTQLTGQPKRIEPRVADGGVDVIDLASQTSQVFTEGQLDNMKWAEIRAIEDALRGIEAGTYGICRDCAEPIAGKRLEALPFATNCLNCAQAIDEQSRPRNGRANVSRSGAV